MFVLRTSLQTQVVLPQNTFVLQAKQGQSCNKIKQEKYRTSKQKTLRSLIRLHDPNTKKDTNCKF